MGQRIMLSVLVPGKVPPTYLPRAVEVTATPGVYVTEHPDGAPGWVLVTECGRWLANYVRWRTAEDAQAVAADLGGHGIDWTLPSDSELYKAHPDFSDCYWTSVERYDDRRHPTSV